MELVKKILVDLHKSLKDSEENERKRLVFKRLDPFDFVKTKTNPAASPKSVRRTMLFKVLCICADTGLDVEEIR